MPSIAVTGHMDLTEDSAPIVRTALDELLAQHADDGELVGLSCIAKGADSLFADAVVARGGRLVAIIPSEDYRQAKVKPDHAATFDRLVSLADTVLTMPHASANRDAYQAANTALIERADRLVAVWDGAPPSGKGGGTADTVQLARAAGLPVDVVWPDGAARKTS